MRPRIPAFGAAVRSSLVCALLALAAMSRPTGAALTARTGGSPAGSGAAAAAGAADAGHCPSVAGPTEAMSMQSTGKFAEFEERARILERISRQYPDNSTETRILKEASLALCFALVEKNADFTRFVSVVDHSLTGVQKAPVAKRGAR